MGLAGDRLQQRERHILADHSRRLEQALVSGSEAVDASGQDRLRRCGELKSVNPPSELVGTAFSRESSCFDQSPHALLEKEGLALGTIDQEPCEIVEPGPGAAP